MGLLARKKPVDQLPPAQAAAASASKKIMLNFGGGTKAVKDMAAATLEAGGFDPVIAEPRPHHVGDKMPDGTIYAGVSPDTGKAMYAMPADAPLRMTFNDAKKYAKKLDAHGHQDWRVPTEDELGVLFNNRVAIGGFRVIDLDPAGWYWSSSQSDKWGAWQSQRFSDGARYYEYKVLRLSVRCVR